MNVLKEEEPVRNLDADLLEVLKLVIIRGVPGSGKTALTTELQKIMMNESKIVVIDPDQIDKKSEDYVDFVAKLALSDPDVDPKFYDFRFLSNQAKNAVNSQTNIIWDQPFTDLEGMKYAIAVLVKEARNKDIKLGITVVELTVSRETSIDRVKQRYSNGGHGLTIEQIDQYRRKYSSAEEIGYPTLKLFTDNVSPQELAENIISKI